MVRVGTDWRNEILKGKERKGVYPKEDQGYYTLSAQDFIGFEFDQ